MTIAVIGQCRSGTSLTMQMLHAAGLSAPGEWPAFEDMRTAFRAPGDNWWQAYDAVKFVDAHSDISTFDPAQFSKLIICTRRDVREQAKSINKFNRALMGLPAIPTQALAKDCKKAQRYYERLARGALVITFEHTICYPGKAARRLVDFIGRGDPLEVARAVAPRSTACFAGMLEETLSRGALLR